MNLLDFFVAQATADAAAAPLPRRKVANGAAMFEILRFVEGCTSPPSANLIWRTTKPTGRYDTVRNNIYTLCKLGLLEQIEASERKRCETCGCLQGAKVVSSYGITQLGREKLATLKEKFK